ncbi:hypothetical protein PFICI_08695 [Pestalotiopsis fici W106-1]|uniref:Uncharacterized protein n=1 Tax=Pestalotiopsis fici (strain W106-1 / CGMCC3.15140) TaxID=1229662 RepID=W3X0F7_PESFW|nr:uncharacterized protein PFICI_08695 [Pestalotiopsis fici W106-1]ETS78842.1 hypothetical protein PFICI_08695 [Pestalotiopsis fici W106-1]
MSSPGNESAVGDTADTPAASTSRGRDRPLNPRLRPQRLHHKVNNAMKVVDKKLDDKNATALSDWLSAEEMVQFRRTVREIVRREYNATFDSWPKRVVHNYVPDARKAIIDAINESWAMFDAARVAKDEQYDDFVAADLLFPKFYTE